MVIRILTSIEQRRSVHLYKKHFALLKDATEVAKSIWERNHKDLFLDGYLLIANRLVIDLQATHLLAVKGLYGTCYSICASMVRSSRMLTALQADPNIREKYIDEDTDTYQTEADFRKHFRESELSKKIDAKFGTGTAFVNELDKTLHGSAFGARKYYCKRYLRKDGLRAPFLPFGPIYEHSKVLGIFSILQGICLDNIGIMLEEYGNRGEFSDIKSRYFACLGELDIIH